MAIRPGTVDTGVRPLCLSQPAILFPATSLTRTYRRCKLPFVQKVLLTCRRRTTQPSRPFTRTASSSHRASQSLLLLVSCLTAQSIHRAVPAMSSLHSPSMARFDNSLDHLSTGMPRSSRTFSARNEHGDRSAVFYARSFRISESPRTWRAIRRAHRLRSRDGTWSCPSELVVAASSDICLICSMYQSADSRSEEGAHCPGPLYRTELPMASNLV